MSGRQTHGKFLFPEDSAWFSVGRPNDGWQVADAG